MNNRPDPLRLLIYSHDSFGLGHLRRCRTIAHSLVDQRRDLSVLILSGSPIIGSFDFRSRVDFVRIPGVIKLRNGSYTPLGLEIGVEEALAIRETIIRNTADVFKPDVFLTDKEPLGLQGEVSNTLEMLKAKGTRLVLGLRDVMDDPGKLSEEWERKSAVPALRDLYDDIWVYGLPEICNPLEGVGVPKSVMKKLYYTGYLRRTSGSLSATMQARLAHLKQPYILVTPGGGGDGASLVDWVLRAYEHEPLMSQSAVIVLGPFMSMDLQTEFKQRAEHLNLVEIITFDANLEDLYAGASGVIAMGGYNTFCEILSFDVPGLIVPRTVPRLEQYIRASRAQDRGLIKMLMDDGKRDPAVMVNAIRQLSHQKKPSSVHIPGLLDGLSEINATFDRWFSPAPDVQTEPQLTLVQDEA